MNIKIRQIIYLVYIYGSIVVLAKKHILGNESKTMEQEAKPMRLSQKYGYGTVAEVEPSPDIRIYVYNPPNSFNPTNEMFSNRTLRELKNQRLREESQNIQSEFEGIKDSQKRQLALIMDAIERGSKNKNVK